jgi:acetyltransferase-like isoleucine patch superfamily enzyme
MPEFNTTSSSLGKRLLYSVTPFLVFSLGFFPLLILIKIYLYLLNIDRIWGLLLLPFFLSGGIALSLFSQLFISGGIIKLFKIKYEPGVYGYSFSDNNSYKWMIVCALYNPLRRIIEIIHVGRVKYVYYRLLGMKIGKNTLIGGVIKDPCVTEFGDNTTIGEFAIIYGHIHNYKNVTIKIGRVIIGNNCIVGAGSIIMPGSVLQDNVTLAAGALVTQDQILETGKTYAGVPAREIKTDTETSKTKME